MSRQEPTIDASQEDLLGLLRTKGLSIKGLDEKRKAELRALMDSLHNEKGKDTRSYEWNLSTILDSSFEFLLQKFVDVKDWIANSRSVLLSYLAGLLDAEGSIITTRDSRGLATVFVDYYNSDKVLLDWVNASIKSLGFHTSLRINKKKGVKTKKYGIVHNSDYWQLSAFGRGSIQKFLRMLKPRHPEKTRRRVLALSIELGTPYERYADENEVLRSSIRAEVAQYVRKAESEYLAKHPGPSPGQDAAIGS